MDVIVGAGEKLSCMFMTALLKDRVRNDIPSPGGGGAMERAYTLGGKGIDAEYINLENIVAAAYTSTSRGLNQDFYNGLSKSLADRIAQCGDRLPVVTGQLLCLPSQLPELLPTNTADGGRSLKVISVSSPEAC